MRNTWNSDWKYLEIEQNVLEVGKKDEFHWYGWQENNLEVKSLSLTKTREQF